MWGPAPVSSTSPGRSRVSLVVFLRSQDSLSVQFPDLFELPILFSSKKTGATHTPHTPTPSPDTIAVHPPGRLALASKLHCGAALGSLGPLQRLSGQGFAGCRVDSSPSWCEAASYGRSDGLQPRRDLTII